MRIQQLVPPLDAHFAEVLSEIGVKTDVDLLLASAPDVIFARLPQGHGISLKAFRAHVVHATELAAADAMHGDTLLEKERKRRADERYVADKDTPVGVPAVDALLGGSFAPPCVVEISGDSGSGKTALALQVALRHLTRDVRSGVLWIDTSGEFAPDRAELMLERLGGRHVATALERLQVSLAFDIDAAHEVLDNLRRELTDNPPVPADELEWEDPATLPPITRVVVIDAVTPLLSPLLSATSSQGHAIMTAFMRQLRVFADVFGLTVVVINTSTRVAPRDPRATNSEAVFETTRKPALGPSFTFMPDTTLWLSCRPANEGVCEEGATSHVIEVLRSRVVRSRKWARFQSRADGALCSC